MSFFKCTLPLVAIMALLVSAFAFSLNQPTAPTSACSWQLVQSMAAQIATSADGNRLADTPCQFTVKQITVWDGCLKITADVLEWQDGNIYWSKTLSHSTVSFCK